MRRLLRACPESRSAIRPPQCRSHSDVLRASTLLCLLLALAWGTFLGSSGLGMTRVAGIGFELGIGAGVARASTQNAGLPLPAAEPDPARAGLVVQGQDGRVSTFCINLSGESRSGLELLRMAGLDVSLQSFGPGVAICSIGGEGCAYPAEPCWCQCRSLGSGCSYWAYHTLDDGRWRYAALGPTGRRVQAGEVDGWAWGPGTLVAGAEPPVFSFDEICAPGMAPPGREDPAISTAVARPPRSALASATAPRRRPPPIATKPPAPDPRSGPPGALPGSSALEDASRDGPTAASGAGAHGPEGGALNDEALSHRDSDPDRDRDRDPASISNEDAGLESGRAEGPAADDASEKTGRPDAEADTNAEADTDADADAREARRSGGSVDEGDPGGVAISEDPRPTPKASLPFETLDLLAFLTVLGLLGFILVGARRA